MNCADTKPSSTLNEDNNIALSPPWARKSADQRTSASKAIVAPSTIDVSSKFASMSNNTTNVQKQHLTRQTKQKLLSKPVDRVGSVFELPPSGNIIMNKGNGSISIRHGGTPVWIHASILSDNGALQGIGWDWIRGFLHAGNGKSDESVE